MSATPFRDKARLLATKRSYKAMSSMSGCSANWWKKVVSEGPKDGQGNITINPPTTIGQIRGIAILFDTTVGHVAQMIAADWYGVMTGVRSAAESATPFRDEARQRYQHQGWTYEDLHYFSEGAYSASWWRSVVIDGPRDVQGTSTVDAPTIDKIDGIAKALSTTPEHVAEMVAADWYGVVTGVGVSGRVKNLIPLIDGLSDEDAWLVESMLRRLNDH